ncbi:MAG: zinc dependent phospholipase C family protein [Bacteroidota bacterium]
MKNLRLTFLTIAVLLSGFSGVKAWGFWAHQRINRMAVFTLPPDMMVLYKKHLEYLTVHAVDPDKRRYAVNGEAPRHYIDIDHYGENPFEVVPREWEAAVKKLSEDTLMAYGIVPWHIQRSYFWLVGAFRDGNIDAIMKLSADLGHYVADANVPLHTTENYNGQMTGQKGIHALWESRLPEIFGEDYNYFIGRAEYQEDILEMAWQGVYEAHMCLDSVLGFEQKLTERFPSDRKYAFENRNNSLTKAYSREFCEAYHNMLNGQVERRARASILRVGSLWYSAWVDAGQPDLKALIEKELAPRNDKYDRKLKIIDREANAIGMAVPHNTYELVFGQCSGHQMERHVCVHHREKDTSTARFWPLRAADLGL